MFEKGNVVASIGSYDVVEATQTFLDGKTEVVGYWVFGSGADSTFVNPTLELAKEKASQLAAKRKPGAIPKP